MRGKTRTTFIKFDIIDFYSSISRDLIISDCINFAKNYMVISDEEIDIIFAARKLLLSLNDSTWIKCGSNNFDVLMRAYDLAEVADLVCIYILEIFSRIVELELVHLYRDD